MNNWDRSSRYPVMRDLDSAHPASPSESHSPGGSPGLRTGTISRKTGTFLFGKPHIAPRLAGFGIRLAPKKHLLAPFGATISGRIGLYYSETGKTPVLAFRSRLSSDGYRRRFWGCVLGNSETGKGGCLTTRAESQRQPEN